MRLLACFLLLAGLSSGMTMAAVDPLQVDPGLIQQLFEQRDPNQQIPKRPFNLDELVGLLTDTRLVERLSPVQRQRPGPAMP